MFAVREGDVKWARTAARRNPTCGDEDAEWPTGTAGKIISGAWAVLVRRFSAERTFAGFCPRPPLQKSAKQVAESSPQSISPKTLCVSHYAECYDAKV